MWTAVSNMDEVMQPCTILQMISCVVEEHFPCPAGLHAQAQPTMQRLSEEEAESGSKHKTHQLAVETVCCSTDTRPPDCVSLS